MCIQFYIILEVKQYYKNRINKKKLVCVEGSNIKMFKIYYFSKIIMLYMTVKKGKKYINGSIFMVQSLLYHKYCL